MRWSNGATAGGGDGRRLNGDGGPLARNAAPGKEYGSETIGAPMAVDLRPMQALRLWHDVTMDLVRDGEQDLSARQTAILLTIYLETPPHTVRGLARKLGVTKPAVTRALDTMGRLQLVSRRRDDEDRRNVVIQRTVKGALFVERLGDLMVARAKEVEP
jgi:DNA-binding MarR family transcriptional regulator